MRVVAAYVTIYDLNVQARANHPYHISYPSSCLSPHYWLAVLGDPYKYFKSQAQRDAFRNYLVVPQAY